MTCSGAPLYRGVPRASEWLPVRGRGVASGGGGGDLILKVELDVPTELNPGQRAALEAFAAATTTSPRAHLPQ
jgi:DnaJ-class molecular chaperone